MARTLDPVRRAAFDALQAVTLDDAYANLATAQVLDERGLDSRDARFVTELVHGTCRGLGTYDVIIEAASGRSLDTLDAGVVDVLRLAAHQLLAMRVPTHAGVDSSVDLAALAVSPRVAGLVNAVARRIAARDLAGWLGVLAESRRPLEALALRTMHPAWVVEAYAKVLPNDELALALTANNQAPQTTLAVRPGLAERDELGGEPTAYSPFGVHITGRPGDHPAVRTGRAGVQDEGSQLVAAALAAVDAPPGPWLDMCAGPGGKAALLTGLARQEGERLLAVEAHQHRAVLVRSALRAFPGFPRVVCADGTEPTWPTEHFARVLADVPCSGLGALRRRPEARWRHQPEDVTDLAWLQRALLSGALDAARPGGVVAYVTCSPHREETAAVVADVLGGRDDATLLDAPACLPQVPEAAAQTDARFVQLWPHRHGTDAMFLALLRRV